MARPRIYPPGEEPTNRDHLKSSRQRLKERGGRLVQARLEPEESAALERLKAEHNLRNDRDAVAFAIMTALRK